jgi:hypothetical protein
MLQTWLHVTPPVAHHSTNSIKYVQCFNKTQGITINTPASYAVQILTRSLAIITEILYDWTLKWAKYTTS